MTRVSDTAQDLGGAAARGSGITLVAQAVRVGVHFASLVVLSRLLTPADFGLVAMVTALVGISEVLRDLGLSMAAVQAPVLTRAQKSNLFWINSASGLVFAGAIFALAEPIALLFGADQLVAITRAVAVVYLVNGIAAQFRAELNRDLQFGRLAVVDTVPQIAGLAVAIWVAAIGGGYWALVLQLIVYSAGALVAAMALARWWPGIPRRRAGMRPLITFGLSLTGTQAIGYFVRSVDTIALGISTGATSTGLYNRAYQLVAAPFAQLAAPLTRVAIPVLARTWQTMPTRYEEILGKAQLVGCYAIAPLYAALLGLAPSIVAVALGPGWGAAVPIVQALCIGGVFRALTQISYWAYLSRGEATKQLKVHAWFQPVIVIAVLVGLPWGPFGVALGGSIGLLLYWVVSMIAAGRNLQIDAGALLRRATASILVLGVPIAALTSLAEWFVANPFGAIGAGLGVAALYLAVLGLLSRRVRGDYAALWNFVRKVRTR